MNYIIWDFDNRRNLVIAGDNIAGMSFEMDMETGDEMLIITPKHPIAAWPDEDGKIIKPEMIRTEPRNVEVVYWDMPATLRHAAGFEELPKIDKENRRYDRYFLCEESKVNEGIEEE